MSVDPRIQAALDAPLRHGQTLRLAKDLQRELFGGLPPATGKYAARGYAAAPGTGPLGETCRTCKHCFDSGAHSHRIFYKCGLSRCQSRTKNGDVSTRSPACAKWEAKA